MRSLHQLNPGVTCVPVSESEDKSNEEFPYTVTMDFSSTRGFLRARGQLIPTVKKILEEHPGATLHAVLDYFWLEHNYYEARYGGRWVTAGMNTGVFKGSKVSLLLEMGFSRVSLPVDGGVRNRDKSHIRQVLPLLVEGKVPFSCTKPEDEPLWQASNTLAVDHMLEKENRGNNHSQTRSYLPNNDCMFIVFRK